MNVTSDCVSEFVVMKFVLLILFLFLTLLWNLKQAEKTIGFGLKRRNNLIAGKSTRETDISELCWVIDRLYPLWNGSR